LMTTACSYSPAPMSSQRFSSGPALRPSKYWLKVGPLRPRASGELDLGLSTAIGDGEDHPFGPRGLEPHGPLREGVARSLRGGGTGSDGVEVCQSEEHPVSVAPSRAAAAAAFQAVPFIDPCRCPVRFT
jgi:hypothetical protein